MWEGGSEKALETLLGETENAQAKNMDALAVAGALLLAALIALVFLRPQSKAAPGQPELRSQRSPPAVEAVYDYSRLVWSDSGGRLLPAGVNVNRLEAHLSDGQFREVLGVDRSQFYAMTIVEQMRVKQEVGLF